MQRKPCYRLLAAVWLVVCCQTGLPNLSARDDTPTVRNTSYVTKTGERVLRIETVVPASVEQVWQAWTTQNGLQKWIAPVANIDLRVGGNISTNYNAKARIGDPGTIVLPIVNYLDNQLIVLKVELNDTFPKRVRNEERNLQEIVQIVDAGNARTKIISSMVGWGTGQEWNETYDFFTRGNEWTYKQLAKYLSAV